MESFDAVLVELEGFVVNGTDEVLAGAGGIGKNRSSFRIFLRLREHERRELFPRKGTRAIKKSAIEIFVQSNLSGIESGKREIVAILKFFVVEIKCSGRLTARAAVPAVGKNDAADIPKQRCDFTQ